MCSFSEDVWLLNEIEESLRIVNWISRFLDATIDVEVLNLIYCVEPGTLLDKKSITLHISISYRSVACIWSFGGSLTESKASTRFSIG